MGNPASSGAVAGTEAVKSMKTSIPIPTEDAGDRLKGRCAIPIGMRYNQGGDLIRMEMETL